MHSFYDTLVSFAERWVIKMKRKVVIITDCTDVALVEMRGVIHSYAKSDEYEIEPIVAVDNYSIINTAFLFDLVVNTYPAGTVILIVVNPSQLRTERIIGRLKFKDIIFDGTNTGALGLVINKYGCSELYEIHDEGFVPFGGKYVHSPTIGKILAGQKLCELGNEFDIEGIRTVEIKNGTVFHVDNFGNVKMQGDLGGASNGDKFVIEVNGKILEAVFWKRMMERNDGEIVIYPGSSFGLPEIGIVRGNFSEKYGVKPGDTIKYNMK